MLVGKTYEQIMEDMRRRIDAGAIPGVSWSAGSIVRAILAACGEEIAEAYRTIDFAVEMMSVSTSRGMFLDMLGAIVGIYRGEDESDEQLRARITAQEFSRAGKNETALRIACLAAPYVRDVVLKKFPYGPGSLAVYVIPESRDMYEQAMAAVESVLESETAGGVQAFVMRPVEIPIDLEVVLVFKESTPERVRADVRVLVRDTIRSYIENIEPGGDFLDTSVIQAVRNASGEVVTCEVSWFAVGGVPAIFARQSCEWNERFVPGVVRVL